MHVLLVSELKVFSAFSRESLYSFIWRKIETCFSGLSKSRI